jgi:hypothetical protein
MAAMTQCKTCKKEISRNARPCPHCGEPFPVAAPAAAQNVGVGCGVVLAILVVVGIFGVMSSSNDKTDKTPAATGSAGGDTDTIQPRTIVGDSRFGCVDRDFFEKLGSYAAEKDNAAFSNALGTAVLNGDCVFFKADEPVYLADTAIFSGLVKVRRPGETEEYWTNMEALSK